MIFGNPKALWFLIALPFLLGGIGYLGWAHKQEIAMLFVLDLQRLKKEQLTRYFLAGVPLLLFVAGLAGPELRLPSADVVRKTGEVLLLVDVSGSMGARTDLNQLNRLERVKPILNTIIDQMEKMSQVRLSLYGFTGIARSLVPFVGSEDYPYLKEANKNVLDIYSIPGHGTSLGQSILNVLGKFSNGTQAKLIVLFSDGEIFIGSEPGMHEVERDWIEEAVAQANKNGIHVITVGVGETEGAKIPLINSKGNPAGDYVQLKGADYISFLKEDTLIELANRTGGEYFKEGNQKELLAYIEKGLSPVSSEASVEDTVDYRPIAHWCILIAMPFWIILARRYINR